MCFVKYSIFGKQADSLWTATAALSEPTVELQRFLFPKTSVFPPDDILSLESSMCLALNSAKQPQWSGSL